MKQERLVNAVGEALSTDNMAAVIRNEHLAVPLSKRHKECVEFCQQYLGSDERVSRFVVYTYSSF